MASVAKNRGQCHGQTVVRPHLLQRNTYTVWPLSQSDRVCVSKKLTAKATLAR